MYMWRGRGAGYVMWRLKCMRELEHLGKYAFFSTAQPVWERGLSAAPAWTQIWRSFHARGFFNFSVE
jgi:hypothetical protein